jgi:hypothetical protein
MAVSLTISETLGGAALSDSLAGGGTGLDLGSVTNGVYAPLVDKTLNQGRQDLFIKHNATVDPITDLRVYIAQFGSVSGATYGGQRTSAGDLADLIALGNASGNSKNNADGLSGGLWVDMRWNASDSQQFDKATYPTLVKIFGDNGTDGIDVASGFAIPVEAMIYNNAGSPVAATTPVASKIGVTGDTVLGDNAHLRFRQYLTSAWAEGGIYQYDIVFSYTYTA